MRCLDAVLSLDGTLDKKATQRRTMFFVFNIIALLMTTGTLGVWGGIRGRYLYCVTGLVTMCAAICATVLVLCKGKLTTPTIVCVAYIYALVVFSADITARSIGNTGWGLLVLVVDFLLVMEVPTRYSMCVVCVAVVYFFVMGVEEFFRFGLLDMPGIMPQEERAAYRDESYQCADLPCPVTRLRFNVAAVSVFVIDFIATRGFARGLLKEQASMERTINAVQEIAALLADYDVEQVAELLKAHEGDLPEEMTAALRNLEENLRKYRPYLPAALFEVDEDGVQQPTVAPPGLDKETATIVFTDIRASTSIWENAPEGCVLDCRYTTL